MRVTDLPLPAFAASRRYPFRHESEEERIQLLPVISSALSGVEDMIYDIARRRCNDDVCTADIEDIVQRVRQHLWTYSLPRYDSTDGALLSTYLYSCILNAVRDHLAVVLNAIRLPRHPKPTPNLDLNRRQAADCMVDRRVERLFEAIRDNPHRFFPAAEAAIVQELTRGGLENLGQLAKRLGFKYQKDLSPIIARIRQQIMSMDVEELCIANETHRTGQPEGDL